MPAATQSRLSEHDFRWFAARLMVAMYDVNVESRRESGMSVEVKGLAATIRDAKKAIANASDASARMQASAQRLTSTLAQVEEMTSQLDAAHAELQAAVGQLSNGGPPLEEPAQSSPATSVAASLRMVEDANKGNV